LDACVVPVFRCQREEKKKRKKEEETAQFRHRGLLFRDEKEKTKGGPREVLRSVLWEEGGGKERKGCFGSQKGRGREICSGEKRGNTCDSPALSPPRSRGGRKETSDIACFISSGERKRGTHREPQNTSSRPKNVRI